MGIEYYYEVTVDWKAERKGELNSPVLNSTIEVATPPEFAKGMPGIWSPEHLFTAAINSCLMTTFLAIAGNSKLEFSNFSCKAISKLETVEGKFMMSEVILFPVVTINSVHDKERVERILQKAEENCLISNSVKSKIIFKPEIKVVKTATEAA